MTGAKASGERAKRDTVWDQTNAKRRLVNGIDPDLVALYIRWSTEDQEEGTTEQEQRERGEMYIRSQGWTFHEQLVYTDRGYSGSNLDRPALTKLRADVAAGLVQCVVVYRVDRLSRRLVDAVNLVVDEWGNADGMTAKCAIKSATEPIDTSTQLGRLLFYLLAMFAEWERDTIRSRLLSGRDRRADEGQNPGLRLPLGLVKGTEKGDIRLDQAELAYFREAAASFLSGQSTAALGGWLHSSGVRGQRWPATAVAYMLRNRAYLGEQNWRRPGGKSSRQRDDGAEIPRLMVIDEHGNRAPMEPVIPPETFAAIQEELDRRAQSTPAMTAPGLRSDARALSSRHLLTGLIRCRCGAPVIAHTDSRTGKWRYLPEHRRARITNCDGGLAQMDAVDNAVIEALHLRLNDPTVQQAIEQQRAKRLAELDDLRKLVTVQEAALRAYGDQEERAARDYRTAQLDAISYRQLQSSIEADRKLAAGELHAARERLGAAEAGLSRPDRSAELLRQFAAWDTMTPELQKHVLQQLVRKCVFYRKRRGPGDHNNPNPIHIELETFLDTED